MLSKRTGIFKKLLNIKKDIGAKIKSKVSQRIFQNLSEAWVWLSMNIVADLKEFLVFFYFLYFRDYIFGCNILLQHEGFISCG